MATKYNAAELAALGKAGKAFKNPDGSYSYPIADAEDLSNAIRAVGRGNASHNALRRYIIGRAKALGKASAIPETWNGDGSLKASIEVAAALVEEAFGGTPSQGTAPDQRLKKNKKPAPKPTPAPTMAALPSETPEDAPQADGRAPSRETHERAAAAVRAMQEALAPQVDALYQSDAGMDLMEAFDHYGRAADALHYGTPGAIGKALDELLAAAELLRDAAGRDVQVAIGLNPLATLTEQAAVAIGEWPVTHASTESSQLFGAARLVLTEPEPGSYVLTDCGVEVARFAAEGDALQAVAGYALPADDPNTGTPFNVFLAPEGFESGDGRLLELGTTTWRDPPNALMFQDTTAHGPGSPAPAWFAGAISSIWRDPADASRIIGRGNLVPGADGQRAEAMIRAGLRGVSIDGIGGMQRPPVEQVTQVDENGNPINALVRYSDTRIMGATVVAHPAFEPCCIWFDDEPTPERVTMTHGQQIPLDIQPSVVDSGLEALVASAGGPMRPPRDWFFTDEPDHYQPITVRADGFISGHLGQAGTCHIGQVGKCETIPRSSASYRYFHRTLAETASGDKVACGWLTMNTSHQRNLRASASDTMAHYDNTGTQVAKIRVIDGAHGPWACGAVSPGLSEEDIWKLQGPEVSGDWRDIDGHYRELVAVLTVPLPGFLTQRPEALVASGQIVAQIGTLPCDECGPSTVVDFPANGLSVRLSLAESQLALLRPLAMEALRARVSPEGMLAAARAAHEPDPSAHWRERLRV